MSFRIEYSKHLISGNFAGCTFDHKYNVPDQFTADIHLSRLNAITKDSPTKECSGSSLFYVSGARAVEVPW